MPQSMRDVRWVRVGVVISSLLLAACMGPRQTPIATAADHGPAPAAGGWTVADTFGEVSFDAFQAGDYVIVPVKAVAKPDAERFDTSRSAHVYELDAPNPNVSARERYEWGSQPVWNGRAHGASHFYDERLAFDLRGHRVFVLPRGGLQNVDHDGAQPTRFWCKLDALREATIAISGYGPVCPTAFIRTTLETKGPPLLVGLQKELYVIDTRFVAGLIAELRLDEAVSTLRTSENMNRDLAKIAAAQEQAQQAQESERARTAGQRGQAMIDRGELGSLLCSDVTIGNRPAVVSGFLEGSHGSKVQLRVNVIRSPDGQTTFTSKVPIDGVDFTSGNVVWVDREPWRACE